MSDNFSIENIIINIKSNIEAVKCKKDSKLDEEIICGGYINLLDRLETHKEIVIVGAGSYGKLLYTKLQGNGIENIVCFADNSSEYYMQGIFGEKVISVEDAVEKYANAYYVVTPKYHFMELIRQLINLGVSIEQIDCFTGNELI